MWPLALRRRTVRADIARTTTTTPTIGRMSIERQEPVHEATNRDGVAALAIILLTIVLLAFAVFQIVS